MDYAKNEYRAKTTRVIDGDTVQLDVDLGLRVYRSLFVRIAGIDAPEVRGAEKEAGKASKAFLESLLIGDPMPELVVRFEKGKSFDRWIGRLYLLEKHESKTRLTSVQGLMVAAGHATASEK